MWKIILILACCVWLPFCGQPLWGQPAELGGSRANADQKGSKDLPFVVDIEGHQKSPAESADDKRKSDAKSYTDKWTFRFTFANTLFTGVLMLVGMGGVCLALRTLRVLGEQTKATKDSVGVLINSERAWATVSGVTGPGEFGWYYQTTRDGCLGWYSSLKFLVRLPLELLTRGSLYSLSPPRLDLRLRGNRRSQTFRRLLTIRAGSAARRYQKTGEWSFLGASFRSGCVWLRPLTLTRGKA